MWIKIQRPKTKRGRLLGFDDKNRINPCTFSPSWGWVEVLEDKRDHWKVSDYPLVLVSKKDTKAYVLYYGSLVYYANAFEFCLENPNLKSRVETIRDYRLAVAEVKEGIKKIECEKNELIDELKEILKK